MDTQTKGATLVINFSLLEASIHLPFGATHDTLADRVEIVSWPAAVRVCFCGRTTKDTALADIYDTYMTLLSTG